MSALSQRNINMFTFPLLPAGYAMQSTDQGIYNSSVGLTFVGKVVRDRGDKTQDKIWGCRQGFLLLPPTRAAGSCFPRP